MKIYALFFAKSFIRACRGRLSRRPAEFPAIYLSSPYGPPPTAAHVIRNDSLIIFPLPPNAPTPRTGRTPGRPAYRITKNPPYNLVGAASPGGPQSYATASEFYIFPYNAPVGAAVPGGPSRSISGWSINGGRVAQEGDPYGSVRMSYCEIRWCHGPPREAAPTTYRKAFRKFAGRGPL